MTPNRVLHVLCVFTGLAACHGAEPHATAPGCDTGVVYAAASLAGPLHAFADTYAVNTGTVSEIEIRGSIDHARKLTELHRIPDVLAEPGVSISRPDPSIAPAGYRALIMLRLAERTMRRPGLAARVLANAGPRYVRPNAAASARVRGASGDTVPIRGQAILYALAIPDRAPHPDAARRWGAELLGPVGRRDPATAFVNLLANPQLVGTGALPEVTPHAAP